VSQFTEKYKNAVWKVFKDTKYGKGSILKEANQDFVNAAKIEVTIEASADHTVNIINAHQFTTKIDSHYANYSRAMQSGSPTMQVRNKEQYR
jgi:hypothetical protein